MKCFAVAFCLLSQLLCLSQDLTTTIRCDGTVRDVVTNEPLPFVHVRQQGTTHGTVTDRNGNFSLLFPSGSEVVLEFSMVGYHAAIRN